MMMLKIMLQTIIAVDDAGVNRREGSRFEVRGFKPQAWTTHHAPRSRAAVNFTINRHLFMQTLHAIGERNLCFMRV
jgi:hypothetical protein